MSITDLIPVPQGINPGVRAARQVTMLQLLGSPRDTYGRECQAVTSNKLKAEITTRSIGPLRVTGLDKALDSLERVLDEIGRDRPDIHAGLGHAGMLCVRLVRGSEVSISNHSWGTAIDLTLNGLPVDTRGDGFCQRGLADIAPIFNRHGWFWGAGFRTEDAMHFEVGDDKIREWYDRGGAVVPRLSLGDRGPEVKDVQDKLTALGYPLIVDGVFGRSTMAAVMAFQGDRGLSVDGIVGPKTLQALGLK